MQVADSNGLALFYEHVAKAGQQVAQMGSSEMSSIGTSIDMANLEEHKATRAVYFDQHIIDGAYTKDNQDACNLAWPFFPKNAPFDYNSFVSKGVNPFLMYMGKSTRSRYIPSSEQLRVLYSCAPRLLIDSGPGTGKTTTIIRKAFIEQNIFGFDSEDILALTYTEAGATAMNNSYNNLMTEFSSTRFLEFKTIHSWCHRFLSIYADSFDVLTDTRPVKIPQWDEELCEYVDLEVSMYTILTECMEAAGLNTKEIAPSVLHSIMTIVIERNIQTDEDLRTVENILDTNLTLKDILTVKQLYKNQKRSLALIDYNDMLEDARDILITIKKGEYRFKNDLQRSFYICKSIYVDEFQDITPLQMEIIRLLTEINESIGVRLTCIGDIDQAIYAFRGADIRNILRFVEEYKDQGLDVIFLTQNRRSVQLIINLANHIIKNNVMRFPKTIRGMEGNIKTGGSISAWVDQTGGVARGLIEDALVQEWNSAEKRMSQYAIMYRDNRQITPYINMLIENRIPFCTKMDDRRKINYVPFMEETADLLGLIDLLMAPANPDLVYRWLYKMIKYMNKDAAQKISFELRGNPEAKLVGILKRDSRYAETTAQMIKLREALINERMVSSEFLVMLADHYRNAYYDYYLGRGRKQDNLAYVMEYLLGKVKDGSKLLYLRNKVEEDRVWLKTNSNNITGVNFTTFSSSKGLEYKKTFILPIPNISKSQTRYEKLSDKAFQFIQEEARRLFYVAVTRAISDIVYFYETPIGEAFTYNNVCKSNMFTADILSFMVENNVEFGATMYLEG